MNVYPVLAFVSGPYRDPRGPWYIQQNIRSAEECALWLWQRGIPTICPHKNTALFDGAADDEVWLQGDLVMLERCDLVVLTSGWQSSSGTLAELDAVKYRRIPVFEFDAPDFGDRLEEWMREKGLERG